MIPTYKIAANRRAQRAESIARIEWSATIERHRAAERKARDVLKDAIIAGNVGPYVGTSILAAADSLRKAAVIAALAERSEPEPAEDETGSAS